MRQTRTDLDNMKESSIDDLWNIDVTFGADPRDSNPEQTSTPRLFMGGWQVDQKTSHIETVNDLARSVVVYVHMYSTESQKTMEY